VIATGLALVGGGACVLDYRQRELERSIHNSSQENFQSIIDFEIENERPIGARRIYIDKEHQQQLYRLNRHGFFEQTFFPENSRDIAAENEHHGTALLEIQEQVALEKLFWTQKYIYEQETLNAALSKLQSKFFWDSLSFPEKLRRHFQLLFSNSEVRDAGRLFTKRLLEILSDIR